MRAPLSGYQRRNLDQAARCCACPCGRRTISLDISFPQSQLHERPDLAVKAMISPRLCSTREFQKYSASLSTSRHSRSAFSPSSCSNLPHPGEWNTNEDKAGESASAFYIQLCSRRMWRRGPGSNRRIKVLQTSPLPLGYRALAGLPVLIGSLQSAVANPAGAGGRNGAGDEI